MILESLPPFIDDEMYDDDTFKTETNRYYLTILADNNGQFNVGYATPGNEYVIPALVTMHSDSLYEAGMRLQAKPERFKKLSNS